MSFYTVEQLANLHGVAPSTIRRWEASGLVAPPFPMHLLRIQGECGRGGCNPHQRVRTKLVSLGGAGEECSGSSEFGSAQQTDTESAAGIHRRDRQRKLLTQ